MATASWPTRCGRGAAAVVVESPQQSGVPEIIVRDGRRAALALGQAWYRPPGRRLTLLGVTGTNGKTTTTGLFRHLLNADGTARAASARSGRSTAGASRSSPPPVRSPRRARSTCRPRWRTWWREAPPTSRWRPRRIAWTRAASTGSSFAAAVFTNLTRDHLDYHGTMEAYLAAKLKLRALLSLEGVEVVNLDDEAWSALPARAPRVTFGLHPAADVRAAGIVLDASGSRFRLEGRFGSAEASLPLLGDFNVSNALAAVACALGLGPAARRGGEPARRVASGARPDGAHRGRAVRRAPRLRPHAGRARARARDAAAAEPRPAHRGLRVRRRPRSRQAADHGPDRRGGRRSRDRHLRQSAHRGSGRDHRRHRAGHGRRASPAGSWTGWRPSTRRWRRRARRHPSPRREGARDLPGARAPRRCRSTSARSSARRPEAARDGLDRRTRA